jgi:predicted outer membrane protein
MNYRVHRFAINMSADQQRLEQFLNTLEGEVVSIIPNIAKTSLLQIYGVTRKIDFLFIVEKVKK